MNGAIRTLALAGAARGHETIGIRRGYAGLLERDVVPLDPAAVDGISRLGGTILGSSRSAEFPTEDGQGRARGAILELRLDALVVIGGNGSLTGAHLLSRSRPCQVVGLPASIDNDVGHCGLAIGVDTAVNTIVDACDRISDTARAHRRAFIVEVMGRNCGFLAMRAGIAAEADAIIFGESHLVEDQIVERLRSVLRRAFAPGRDKTRCLIIKSEGVKIPVARLAARLQEHLTEDAPGVDVRETVLGHVVRGGSPSALDRMIAQRLGYAAALACEAGLHDVMLAWDAPGAPGAPTQDPSIRAVPIADVIIETGRLLSGESPVVRRRIAMLEQVQDLMAL